MTETEQRIIERTLEIEREIQEQIVLDLSHAIGVLGVARSKRYVGWMAYDAMQEAQRTLERLRGILKRRQ